MPEKNLRETPRIGRDVENRESVSTPLQEKDTQSDFATKKVVEESTQYDKETSIPTGEEIREKKENVENKNTKKRIGAILQEGIHPYLENASHTEKQDVIMSGKILIERIYESFRQKKT